VAGASFPCRFAVSIVSPSFPIAPLKAHHLLVERPRLRVELGEQLGE
jgi:hypothetical protein